MPGMFDAPPLGAAALSEREIANTALKVQEALIRKNSDYRPRLQWRVLLALDAASTAQNPGFQTSEPFDAYYVEATSDSTASVQMVLAAKSDQSQTQNYTTLLQKDSAIMTEPVRGCTLLWSAQAGKTLTLVFYLGIKFQPGSYLTSLTGGIFESYGTAMTANAAVSVTGTVGNATLILASNTNRKKATITNLSGLTLWIGGSSSIVTMTGASAGSLIGIPIPPGNSYEWLNTGAIYGCLDSGSALVGINVEA